MKTTTLAKTKATNQSIASSERGLAPMRHPSDEIMEQLKGYKASVEDRMAAAEFAFSLIGTEITEWAKMEKQAQAKLSAATPENRAAIERLHEIAKITLDRYERRAPELSIIMDKLDATLKRINAAISVLEVDQNLRSVSNLFAVDGFEQMNFNLESESEEIRRLCYTADAFLELEP